MRTTSHLTPPLRTAGTEEAAWLANRIMRMRESLDGETLLRVDQGRSL